MVKYNKNVFMEDTGVYRCVFFSLSNVLMSE